MRREEPSRETPGPLPFCLSHAWGVEGACGWRLHRRQTCPPPTRPHEPLTAATHTMGGPDLWAKRSHSPEAPVLG